MAPTSQPLFSAAGSPFTSSSSSSAPFSFATPSAPKTATPLHQSMTASSVGSTTPALRPENDEDDDDDEGDVLYLQPASFSKQSKAKWKATGRTMLAAVSPAGGETATWVSKEVRFVVANPCLTKQPSDVDKPTDPATITFPDRTLHFASQHVLPRPIRDLYADTFLLFISLQKIVASSLRLPADGLVADVWDKHGNLVPPDSLLGPPSAQTIVHMRRLVRMYLDELFKIRSAEVEDEWRVRYDAAYSIFSLAEILYLPQDGRGEGLLGEEMLDWVNSTATIHINEQGKDIMQILNPWAHPLFWPFIVRCLLRGLFAPASTFLRTLSSHPHRPIAQLGITLATHVATVPRSTNTAAYPLDHQFLSAHAQWRARLRAEVAVAVGGKDRGTWFDSDNAGGSGSSGGDEWRAWEDDFRSVIELLEGNADRVFEESADWREALGAWGVLVDVGVRRDDLPVVMGRVLDQLPIDSTILEDKIQAALCSGDILKLDFWLAAHLGDIFDKLALIPDDEANFDTSLRDFFLLQYAEYLASTPSHADLWRVVAEYLAEAGEEGRNRLRTYIMLVSLEAAAPTAAGAKPANDADAGNGDAMDLEDGATRVEADAVDAQARHFDELQRVCESLRLEDEWKMINTIMAERLIRREHFGQAARRCFAAGDGRTLSRIADRLVDAFIEQGDDTFLALVDTLPAAMLSDAPAALAELPLVAADGAGAEHAAAAATAVLLTSRLACLSELRDYLLYLRQDMRARAAAKLVNLLTADIAPAALWAVLLALGVPLLEDDEILFSAHDTFELMRVLEEVLANAAFAELDYLGMLRRYLEREAAAGPGKPGGGGGFGEARRRLDEVRLALARNLARALVAGFDSPF